MGLPYVSFDDDDDDDLNAYDLRQEMQPSNQSGTPLDPKKVKDAPGFFDGSSTAVQRGSKARLNKVVLSLLGSEQDNLDAARNSHLQKQLYEEAKRQGKVGANVTFEQYTSQSYQHSKKQTMQAIKDNSANESDGLGAQILNSLGDYGTGGLIGRNAAGAAYVVGTSTHDYTYNKLIDSGVDQRTANKAALNDGVIDAIGMAVPVYRGPGALKNTGLIAAPVAISEAVRSINHDLLQDKGYSQQAKEYEFSTEGVLTQIALGGSINRGTAYLENRNTKKVEKTQEQLQEEAEIKDEVVTDLSKKIQDEYSELGLPENDVVAAEKVKQNRNAVEQQILNKEPINPPHTDVKQPPVALTAARVASYTNKPWAKTIAHEAEKRGINPLDAVVISHIETIGTFSTTIQPKTKEGKLLSSAVGLFQALEGTHKVMGGGNRTDGNAQINVGLNYYAHNAKIFKNKFDRNPTGLEIYFMHFFGEGGGPVFLKSPDNILFVDAATRWHKNTKKRTARQQAQSITSSHRFNGMTVGQVKAKYQKLWDDIAKKYGGGSGESRVNTVFDSENNSYDAMTDIVDLSDLVVSNKIDGALNELYPQELQPRDRTRQASLQRIDEIANDLNPELLGESHRVSDGAPIIWRDNVVESGNGRILAISKALQDERGRGYKDYVSRYASDNGIDISEFNNPILVRRRLTDTDRVEFTRLANVSDVAQHSTPERARGDASRLPDSSMLKINNDGSINLDKSADYVRAFVDQLPKSERATVQTSEGRLSQDGKQRIESALVQRAYDDPNLVRRLYENMDDDSKTILSSLLKAAPQLTQLGDLVKQGGRHQNSIASDLAQAAQKLSDIKANGGTVRDYLDQGQLIPDGLGSGAREFLNVFDSNNRSAKAIGEHIQSKINEVEALGDPRQGSLFGGTLDQDLALKIMQENPNMPLSAIFEDAAGNQIEVNSVGNLLEKIEQDFVIAKQDEVATKAAISCAMQFG